MMKKIRTLLLTLCIVLMAGLAFAQQKPVLSQYMFSGLVLNPAYAGRHDYTSFTTMYRDQWINVPGAPTLGTFTAQTGFKDRKIGLGMMISDDRIGVHNNLSAYGSYAYYIKFRNGAKFSMGLQAGVDVLRSDWTKLNIYDASDPVFAGSEINYFPNFGTGVFYYTEKFYVGFSVPYILTARKTKTDDYFRDVTPLKELLSNGGNVFDLSPKFKFKPSFLLRIEDNMPLAVDLNANFYYDEIIDLGVSYRQGDAVIGIIGLQVNKYLKFSYAYDYIIQV